LNGRAVVGLSIPPRPELGYAQLNGAADNGEL
jgi:hypothetical protein